MPKPMKLYYRGYTSPDSCVCWWSSYDGSAELLRTMHDYVLTFNGRAYSHPRLPGILSKAEEALGRSLDLVGEPKFYV